MESVLRHGAYMACSREAVAMPKAAMRGAWDCLMREAAAPACAGAGSAELVADLLAPGCSCCFGSCSFNRSVSIVPRTGVLTFVMPMPLHVSTSGS